MFCLVVFGWLGFALVYCLVGVVVLWFGLRVAYSCLVCCFMFNSVVVIVYIWRYVLVWYGLLSLLWLLHVVFVGFGVVFGGCCVSVTLIACCVFSLLFVLFGMLLRLALRVCVCCAAIGCLVTSVGMNGFGWVLLFWLCCW